MSEAELQSCKNVTGYRIDALNCEKSQCFRERLNS